MNILSKNNLEEFLIASSYSVSLPNVGDFVSGTVIEKKGTFVFIDLGGYKTGIIYGREFYEARDIIKNLKVGDEITAKVVEPENEEGFVELSLREAGQKLVWDSFMKKKEAKEIFTVKIRQANKGGLVSEIGGVQAFLPVSQLSFEHYPRIEGGDKEKILAELNKFVNKEFQVRIIDVNPRENKLVVSEKEILSDEIRKILIAYKVGDVIEGEIGGITNFGAFVKFSPTPEILKKMEGGEKFLVNPPIIEGLIHISELDWQLVDDPNNFVKIGEKVKAKISSIEGNKISLSLKALKPDPWIGIAEKFKVGDLVKGVVAKINNFGAFIKIVGAEILGLCRISENILAPKREYDFKIVSFEPSERKIHLELVKKEEIKTS